MKYMAIFAVAVSLAVGATSAASAATVTKSFEFFATDFGAGAPKANVSGHFTFTFDPAVSGSGSLDALSIPSLGLSSGGYSYSANPAMPAFSFLNVGGLPSGVGTVNGSAADFVLSFLGVASDPFSYLPANFSYSTGDGKVWSTGAFQVSPYVQTAVPEPATWAMMIAGFGLAGAALRRRTNLALA